MKHPSLAPRSGARRGIAAAAAVGVCAGGFVLLPGGGAASAAIPVGNEQGVTVRVYNLGYTLQELCTLTPGQTPNTDVKRSKLDLSSIADFGGGPSDNFFTEVSADLTVEAAGYYQFRIFSDDGSRLTIGDTEVALNDGNHDASQAVEGAINLTAGTHKLLVQHYDGIYDQAIRVEWKTPGATGWSAVPESVLSTEANVTRVTAPGLKTCVQEGEGPGDGAPLVGVHPDYELTDLRPNDQFQPKITGMDWMPDGRLVYTTWGEVAPSEAGEVWVVDNVHGKTGPSQVKPVRVASGLKEPMGINVIGNDLYVSEKNALTKLSDKDGNGSYETESTFATFLQSDNYHEFAFGLIHDDDYFYLSHSVPIGYLGHTTQPQPVPDRGTWIRVSRTTGKIDHLAGGLRTPNGIGWAPDGKSILVADNQGDWLPSSKFMQMEPGKFYGHYNVPAGEFDDQPAEKPVLWLPQNEIANSPTTPIVLKTGPYAGQLAWGDVTYGGIQRASLEKIDGHYQGAAFRMTQGLESGVNRLLQDDAGDIYIGGIGGGGNWNQPGKFHYGLQKLSLKAQQDTFDFKSMLLNDTNDGFELTYTKPISPDTIAMIEDAYQFEQWGYRPTNDYGGPKIAEETLEVSSATVSADGKTVDVKVEGLKPNRVVHVRSPRPFKAADGDDLWSTEAWYTMSRLPGSTDSGDLNPTGMYEAEDAFLADGAGIAGNHPGYTSRGFVDGFTNPGANITFRVDADQAGTQQVVVRYANGQHPTPGMDKKVSMSVNGGAAQQVTFPSTGTWPVWGDLTIPVTLQPGSNTIKFTYGSGDDGWVNFDHLRLFKQACAPAKPEAGFTMLLDGTDASRTANWDMVAGGGFISQADCSQFTTGGIGLLKSKKEYTDYVLKADWKMAGDDNSGIYLGFPDPGTNADPRTGYEVQIDASDASDRTTGAIYTWQAADAAAVEQALNPPGQWNSYEIRKVGQRITVLLNGVQVNDFTSPAERDITEGFIGLQNHGTGDDVWFRNVQIKDLTEVPVTQTTTSVTLPATSRYGARPVAVVKVTAEGQSVAGGQVEVLEGATSLAKATLGSDGTARVTLPQLAVGAHQLTVRFAGMGESVATSSTTASHTVSKALSTTRATLTKKSISAVTTANPAVPVAGKAQVVLTKQVGKRQQQVLKRTVAVRNGRVALTMKALKRGTYQVTVTYAGSPTVAGSRAVKTLVVRR